jgi:glycerol-3-phosphate O-acyltransferase
MISSERGSHGAEEKEKTFQSRVQFKDSAVRLVKGENGNRHLISQYKNNFHHPFAAFSWSKQLIYTHCADS